VLSEGRHFRNPYFWGWTIAKITDIPAGKLGVLTRLYGRDPPSGRIIAEGDCNQVSPNDEKGILSAVLRPGKYRINPYACRVELFDAIAIRPGAVGVVTSLVGQDVLSNDLSPQARNTYLVSEGMKGVVPRTLDPGVYYLNPYVYNVVEVTLQSQRFVLGGEDAISFLTLDGFNVNVEGTIEFSIERDQAALMTHQVGDMEDVLKKLILPRARGFSRIEGSKHPAINFIVGETRQKFQDNLEQHLREKARPWGVAIKSVLIRNIGTPDAISSVIRDREVSVQNARKYEQQIEQARSLAELTRQEMLAQQNQEKVAAETSRIQAVIRAEQDLAVQITAANRELEVAKLENQAAAAQAEAILAKAQADRDVIALNNQGAGQRDRFSNPRLQNRPESGALRLLSKTRAAHRLDARQRYPGQLRRTCSNPICRRRAQAMNNLKWLHQALSRRWRWAWLIWQWGFCRFYVEPGYMAIMTAKTGDALPPGSDSRPAGPAGD
jgi:regulator of protease activity HflC (stomatin/prohibitin superfamily)